MANLIITHPDGRRFEVADTAYTDLYQPYGFVVEGVRMPDGSVKADSKDARSEASDVPAGDTDHDLAVRLSMARTDVQTNGVSLDDAAKQYGVTEAQITGKPGK